MESCGPLEEQKRRRDGRASQKSGTRCLLRLGIGGSRKGARLRLLSRGGLRGRRPGGGLRFAAAEGLKAEFGDLLLADAVVLLDGGPGQGGQPVALGGELAELLGSLLLA